MVHPWGIDDGQGWDTPEPAGVCDFCTPDKNHLAARHTRNVINPFLKGARSKVPLVMYSLPGDEDPIRKKLYCSVRAKPNDVDRQQGAKELTAKLKSFEYKGQPLIETISLSAENPVRDYFRQFPGLDASAKYNNEGFWNLPIPVTKDIDVDPNDVRSVLFTVKTVFPNVELYMERSNQQGFIVASGRELVIDQAVVGRLEQNMAQPRAGPDQ